MPSQPIASRKTLSVATVGGVPTILAAILMFCGVVPLSAAEPPKPVPAGEVLEGSAADAQAVNLIPNGDFESGEITPTGWQSVDGLSSFWVDDEDPAHGKVLKIDTDILQSQGYEQWARIAAGGSPADAPAKLPTVEPKYDTLAGLDGVWFWSDPIKIERGKSYWLTIDAKGPGMLAWLVGYPDEPDTSFGADAAAFQGYLQKERGEFKNERGRKAFIHKYVWKGQMAFGGSVDQWKTYSRRQKPFRPTHNTPTVKYVRVMLYPFWPPAIYKIDNVRLTEVESPKPAE